MKKYQIILISGGSCSGKSNFSLLIKHAIVVSMDHFYFGKSLMKPEANGSYNFDAPESVDLAACAQAAITLSEGEPAEIPLYDMKTSERTGVQTITPKPDTKFIVVEGIFVLCPPLREIGDMKIFIDTPTEIRVARRMLRDQEKGRDAIDTLEWSVVVEKNHKKYIEPTKQYADMIIPFSYNPLRLMTSE